jgi:hypothetical protein
MNNLYFLNRIGGLDPDLRAADADREHVAERLRKSHAEGRLDMDEFQERLEQCYRAKTLGELRALVRGLPRQDEQVERRSFSWIRPSRLALLAPLLLVLLVVSAATGHEHHAGWLWIPLAFIVWRMLWWRRRRHWMAGPRSGSSDWI